MLRTKRERHLPVHPPETGRAPLGPSERRVALGEADILLGCISVFEDVENLAVSHIWKD